MRTDFLPDSPELPLVIRPEGNGSVDDARSLLEGESEQINAELLKYGGLLLRGFQIETPEEFQSLAAVVTTKFADYTRGTSPRTKVQGAVYNSTEAPKFLPIPLHCELSYVKSAPERILFYCHTAPTVGGETPIADMQAVYRAIDPNVRRRFEDKGLKIVQNVPPKPSRFSPKSWPEMFSTNDRQEVEQKCSEQEIECTWKPDGTLRLINFRPATIRHPETGEPIWFNSAHQFHDSWSWELRRCGKRFIGFLRGLTEKRRRRRTAVEDYPIHCLYGDGTEIATEDMEHIRQVLWDHAILFPWQTGDLLILDNFRVAHGRMPFQGPRRILVAMGNMQKAVTNPEEQPVS